MKNCTRLNACRICGNRNLYMFLDLGMQPPANAFIEIIYTSVVIRSTVEKGEFTKEDLEKAILPEGYNPYLDEKQFPLRVALCEECGLVQLLYVVSPEVLFEDYAYFTGNSSKTMIHHFRQLAVKLQDAYIKSADELVIDIGGNDGTLLDNFSCRTLNVEPAKNVAERARGKGIETVGQYFSAKTAFEIMQEYGKAKVIIGTNVFAHVNNLYDFMAGVSCLLEDDGVFVIEVPYLLRQLEKCSFDQFYHEHLSYFSVRTLDNLAERFGFCIFRVEEVPVHGGSIRAYFRRGTKIEGDVIHMMTEEECLQDKLMYDSFRLVVNGIKTKLINMLIDIKGDYVKIIGYGAPAKGNVLLNYCGIGRGDLDYLIDTTPYKQGKISPGMHVPIYSPKKFYEHPPDYALMLPWNYEKEILEKEKKFIENGGKFIVPFPYPRIIP